MKNLKLNLDPEKTRRTALNLVRYVQDAGAGLSHLRKASGSLRELSFVTIPGDQARYLQPLGGLPVLQVITRTRDVSLTT